MTGKKRPNPEEVAAAAAEITDLGVEPPPEEVPGTENVTTWDEAPSSAGHATPKYSLDQEENQVGQDLVEGGVESAVRDQRVAAADPDYEP